MSLHKTLREEVLEAMKAKDKICLKALRSILSELTNELIRNSQKPQEELSDEKVTESISRLVKQRRDSIEQFQSGGREDLVQNEAEELEVLEKYLPEMMDLESIRLVVKSKKDELSITDKAKMGILIGAVMKDLKGKADGSDVKSIVEEELQ